MSDKLLWLDLSKWQPRVSYRILKDAGVFGIIAKCSQGSVIKDERFTQHIKGAADEGLEAGAYHWFDPIEPYENQLGNIMRQVLPETRVKFIAVDVEQYWTWGEYYAAHREGRIIKQNIHGLSISEGAYRLVQALVLRYDCPILVYTRTSFILDRAPQMLGWVTNFPLWLASWPYARGKVTTSWETLKGYWAPVTTPKLPKGASHYTFWQWSGDKFILPGLYGGPVDLNWFNGNQDAYYSWLEDGEIDPFDPEPGGGWYRARYRLNVRKEAGDMRTSAIIGKIEKGKDVYINKWKYVNGNRWGECGVIDWGKWGAPFGWVAETYSGVKLLEAR